MREWREWSLGDNYAVWSKLQERWRRRFISSRQAVPEFRISSNQYQGMNSRNSVVYQSTPIAMHVFAAADDDL